jgi:hypothetical protein
MENTNKKPSTKAKTKLSADEKDRRKYKKDMQKDTRSETSKTEPRKLSDLENPAAMTVDLRAEQALRQRVYTEQPTQLVPLREKHTRDTLGVNAQHTDERPEPRVMPPGSLYEQMRETSSRLYQQRNTRIMPMEELVRQGLLSVNLLTIQQRQDALAGEIRGSTNFVLDQISQINNPLFVTMTNAAALNSISNNNNNQRLLLTNSGNIVHPPLLQGKTLKSTKKTKKNVETMCIDDASASPMDLDLPNNNNATPNGSAGPATQVKLSIGFTYNDHAFGYERRQDGEKRDFCFATFDKDREQRRTEFFKDNQLEGDTKFSVRPMKFHMMREMCEEYATQFEQRDTVMSSASPMVGRVPFEVVSRAYIRRYRFPPTDGQQLCYNGTQCRFFVASPDPNIRYIGRAFFTERQEEQLRRGEPLDANQCGLCIDCLLLDFTRRQTTNGSRQDAPLTQFNHFGVIEGPGEYAADSLVCEFNGYNTGITGCVPRYDVKKRCISYTTRHQMLPGSGDGPPVQSQVVAFIDETGQDF